MKTLDTSELSFHIEKMLQKSGIKLNYDILEKDYWVVWLLELLFSGPYTDLLTFKGGTSLSKAYKVIDRFSEDVDLTIDRSAIALDPAKSLHEPDIGRAQRTKRNKAFDNSVADFITQEFAPWLDAEIKKHLAGRAGDTAPTLRFDEDDPLNLFFDYPRKPNATEDVYIKPFVRLELGARGDRSPQAPHMIISYIEEELPDAFTNKQSIPVNVLALERTFWEKITILHSVCCRPDDKPPRNRFSRHYYDVHHLAQDEKLIRRAIEDTELLEAIVENKRIYFFESWDWYPTAKRGTFRLVPSATTQKDLAADYQDMQRMIFGDKPEFSEIIAVLKQLEDRINQHGK
ncbi:MAG: nucleotidyl transferase AbiEii/AbiGii toxin family protein [Micavibrio aeruginosavorus]|uniref:Nucleotidyl transferase AbiEii/AbiGii toxin family protein n=1 Tax=Micavibrio aeruginosavorus TaxID=349221 RepID=A0A2W5HBR0_9BACT|nr:MAG: nucleotidyl transferase AbiEii/AbiGii toxin family protein [Micavibrio aeruginosavorus]